MKNNWLSNESKNELVEKWKRTRLLDGEVDEKSMACALECQRLYNEYNGERLCNSFKLLSIRLLNKSFSQLFKKGFKSNLIDFDNLDLIRYTVVHQGFEEKYPWDKDIRDDFIYSQMTIESRAPKTLNTSRIVNHIEGLKACLNENSIKYIHCLGLAETRRIINSANANSTHTLVVYYSTMPQ